MKLVLGISILFCLNLLMSCANIPLAPDTEITKIDTFDFKINDTWQYLHKAITYSSVATGTPYYDTIDIQTTIRIDSIYIQNNKRIISVFYRDSGVRTNMVWYLQTFQIDTTYYKTFSLHEGKMFYWVNGRDSSTVEIPFWIYTPTTDFDTSISSSTSNYLHTKTTTIDTAIYFDQPFLRYSEEYFYSSSYSMQISGSEASSHTDSSKTIIWACNLGLINFQSFSQTGTGGRYPTNNSITESYVLISFNNNRVSEIE